MGRHFYRIRIAAIATLVALTLGIDVVVLSEFSREMLLDMAKFSGMLFLGVYAATWLATGE